MNRVLRIRESRSEILFTNADYTGKVIRGMVLKEDDNPFSRGALAFDDYNYTQYNKVIFQEARNIKTALSGNFEHGLTENNLKSYGEEDLCVVNYLMATREEKAEIEEAEKPEEQLSSGKHSDKDAGGGTTPGGAANHASVTPDKDNPDDDKKEEGDDDTNTEDEFDTQEDKIKMSEFEIIELQRR